MIYDPYNTPGIFEEPHDYCKHCKTPRQRGHLLGCTGELIQTVSKATDHMRAQLTSSSGATTGASPVADALDAIAQTIDYLRRELDYHKEYEHD